jgi:hypothetical protein
MDVRARQDPKRRFGAVPTAVWQGFHTFSAGRQSPAVAATEFLRSTAPENFYRGEALPASH